MQIVAVVGQTQEDRHDRYFVGFALAWPVAGRRYHAACHWLNSPNYLSTSPALVQYDVVSAFVVVVSAFVCGCGCLWRCCGCLWRCCGCLWRC